MGEAFLTKALGYTPHDPLDDVPVVASACSLLVTVRDSGGNKLANIPVHCKDGSKWYNYNTNDQGMVLFQCNSGGANIVAWNYSVIESYNMLDQTPCIKNNIDAPIATKNHIEMILNKVAAGTTLTFSSTKVNQRFMDTSTLSLVKMVGGGGGGAHWASNNYGGRGGAGGAYNYASNISVDRVTPYTITIGDRGSGGTSHGSGSTGGTTSAFGISAVGGSCSTPGGSGSNRGGTGSAGAMYYPIIYASDSGNSSNAGNANYANASFPYGGGGSGGASTYCEWVSWTGGKYSGTPGLGGGRGGNVWLDYGERYIAGSDDTEYVQNSRWYNGGDATGYGGGGGGAAYSASRGGHGKAGVVFITF